MAAPRKQNNRSLKNIIAESASAAVALSALYNHCKKNPGYPFNSFAGLVEALAARRVETSIGHLSNIFKGRRRLDPGAELFAALADIFGLGEGERRRLAELIEADEADDLIDKSKSVRRLAKRREFRAAYWKEEVDLKIRRAFSILGDRASLPVLAAAGAKGFKADPHQIAQRFILGLTPREIETSLKILSKLGFIDIDKDGGARVDFKSIELSGGREKTDEIFRLFYLNGLKAAETALAKLSFKHRRFGTLVYSLRKSEFPALLALIDEIRHLLQLLLDGGRGIDAIVEVVREIRKMIDAGDDQVAEKSAELIRRLAEQTAKPADNEADEEEMVVQINLGGFALTEPENDK